MINGSLSGENDGFNLQVIVTGLLALSSLVIG